MKRIMIYPVLVSLFVVAGCSGGGGTVLVAGFDLGGPAALPGGGYDSNLTILFTNDIHDQILPVDGKSGGMARHATLMRLLREQAAARGVGVFAANAGDCFEGTLFYERDGGTTLFQLLELMDYDVFQIGNHDHEFGSERLFDVIQTAFPNQDQGLRFIYGNVNPADMFAAGTGAYTGQATFIPATVGMPVLDAFENGFIDLQGTIDPALFDPPMSNSKLFNQNLFFDINGIRIGVFGADNTESLYTVVAGEGELLPNPSGVAENLIFYDPVSSGYASAMIDYLDDPDGDPMTDDGADIIVAVTHVGVVVDQAIATGAVGANGRRIDVIVGGHDHYRLNTALTIDHGGNQQTHIVQAGEKGEFLGRIDLMVDPATNSVELKNAQVLQVTSDVDEDPAAVALIDAVLEAPGGVNQTYGDPFTTSIAQNDWFLPGGVASTSALGSLAADACLAVGNQAPWNLGLDTVVIGNFVFRSNLCAGSVTIADAHAVLPLHFLDDTGLTSDEIDFIDLPGGLREALNLENFPFNAPNLTNITALEYLLEVIYSIEDLIGIIGQVFGLNVGSVTQYVDGLQWSGIEFVVDESGPILQKIDVASILVNGVPLVGNESQPYRLGMNSIIARFAIPFVQFLVTIEDPPGSGVLVSFPTYDPMTNASGLVLWEALRDHLATLGQVTATQARVIGNRPRTKAPDLTFNPIDIVVTPAPTPGTTVTVQLPILNIGETGVTQARVDLSYDPTPGVITDNPDGFTDGVTGYAFPVASTATTGAIGPYMNGIAGTKTISVSFPIPATLTPGTYPIFLRIRDVVSVDPARPEAVEANNGGQALAGTITIQ